MTSAKTNNLLASAVFILASFIVLKIPPQALQNRILSLAFLIAGLYGIVATKKKDKFIF